jgi:nucleoside-diphosphate-sugar epimerase
MTTNFLVVGGTGKTGRRMADRLRERGLRRSRFAQNFSEHFLLDAVRGGEIALPAGPGKEPFRDIADVAVKVVSVLFARDAAATGIWTR